MSRLRRLFRFILNPRARLDQLPRTGASSVDGAMEAPAGRRGRRGYWRALFNFPMIFGAAIVSGLFLVVLFGPVWAPRNPYIASQHIQPHIDPVSGVWVTPPLEPSATYPLGTDGWGNDLYSMLLYGARNTLIAAAFIAMARVILGLVMGAFAGWNEGSSGDRMIMGGIGVLSAVPILISSMILIFALDIRRGLPVFIAALTVLGWTEIAQYIRGEFLILRKRSFIEGARAAGASNFAIAVRHLIPNILPQLLVITFLEVAAVLLLFGELGFVGVYIGGGSHIALGDEISGVEVVNLAEVPEWGAMLAEGYQWLRSKPFVVYPPAFAFFIAIVGFNALGEGLRRFIETVHVSTNFLLRKRMLLVVALLTLATGFIINNTGPAPWFARVAQAFSGEQAYEHVRVLSELEGRGAGEAGARQTAAYLAQKFEEYGLQPGWRDGQYINPIEALLVRPTAQPELSVVGASGEVMATFRHQLDFGFITEGHGGSGQAEFPLTFLNFAGSPDAYDWEDYQGLDLRERIVLLVRGNAPPDFAEEALIRGARGILWLDLEAGQAIPSQRQVKATDASYYLQEPTIPIFRLRSEAAATILSAGGHSLPQLMADIGMANQQGPGWFARDLDIVVRQSLKLTEPETTTVPAVMGYLKGSDFQLSNQLVVIYAGYDGLGSEPDGTLYPGANHGASGAGLLLEVARLWQEQELDPRRSVLFVAWGSSRLDYPGSEAFLQFSSGLRHLPVENSGSPLAARVLVQLDFAGAGGDTLLIHPASTANLVELWERTAAEAGLPLRTGQLDEMPDLKPVMPGQASWLSFAWSDSVVPPTEDTLDKIEVEKLQLAGEALSHALTQIVRESRY